MHVVRAHGGGGGGDLEGCGADFRGCCGELGVRNLQFNLYGYSSEGAGCCSRGAPCYQRMGVMFTPGHESFEHFGFHEDLLIAKRPFCI